MVLRSTKLVLVLVALTVAGLLLAACGDDNAAAELTASDDPTLAFGESDPAGISDGFSPWAGTGALSSVDAAQRVNIYSSAPPMTIDPAVTYSAVFTTTSGEMRFELFADTAPQTVNNFVALARDGYYDGTIFHRVLADFMAQGGDPSGTGTGGPGYRFADETQLRPELEERGLLAMANAGANTNGSQFFITFAPTPWLNGNHTVFGRLVDGDDVLSNIDLRDPAVPSSPAETLVSVEIIEG